MLKMCLPFQYLIRILQFVQLCCSLLTQSGFPDLSCSQEWTSLSPSSIVDFISVELRLVRLSSLLTLTYQVLKYLDINCLLHSLPEAE